jgi:hypothetical protein
VFPLTQKLISIRATQNVHFTVERFHQVTTVAGLPIIGNQELCTLAGDVWSHDSPPLSKGGYGSTFKVSMGTQTVIVKLFHCRHGQSTFTHATMELVMVTIAKARSTIVASARAVGVVEKHGSWLPFIVYDYSPGKRVCDVVNDMNTKQVPAGHKARFNLCRDLVQAFFLKFPVDLVVHADIKGDNVIASWNEARGVWVICMIDFGLSGLVRAPLDKKRLTDKSMWWVDTQRKETFSPEMDTFSVAIMLVQILNPSWSSLFNKERRFSLEYVKEACAGIAFQETRKTLSECLRVPDSRKLLQHFV